MCNICAIPGICGPVSLVRDCSDIKASGQNASGVYEVCVGHELDEFCTNAFCDMESTNGTSLVCVQQYNLTFGLPKAGGYHPLRFSAKIFLAQGI